MTLILYGSEYHPHQAIIHKVLLISQYLVDDLVKLIAAIMKHSIPLHQTFISSDARRKKIYGIIAGSELEPDFIRPCDSFQPCCLKLSNYDKDIYEKNFLRTKFYSLNYYSERSRGYYLDNLEFKTIHYGCLIKKIYDGKNRHYLRKCGKKDIVFYNMAYIGDNSHEYNMYNIQDVKNTYSYENDADTTLVDRLSIYEFNKLLLEQLFKKIPEAEIVSNIGFISLTMGFSSTKIINCVLGV
jgi:hypothetical protein